MQGFQTHTVIQPISIQPLQTQQKPQVTEVRHNAEKHSLFLGLKWNHLTFILHQNNLVTCSINYLFDRSLPLVEEETNMKSRESLSAGGFLHFSTAGKVQLS